MDNTQSDASGTEDLKAGNTQRQRSAIAFPYMDLKAAMALAMAIHEHTGKAYCEDDQLAAWTGQSPKSSTYRVQVYAARMFGLIEGDTAKHKLTELGNSIVDPTQAREAKVRAFLNVPLYSRLYERYKGGSLPPSVALQQDIVTLGVAEKQKERARAAFERSAEEAGFFEHGRHRLVKPGIANSDSSATPQEQSSVPKIDDRENNLDPLVLALIQKLPKAGVSWEADQRITWLQMMAMAFQMSYGSTDNIEIKRG